MKKISFLISVLIYITFSILIFPQDLSTLLPQDFSNSANQSSQIYQMETGDILDTIHLINDRAPLGVTVVNSIFIVSSSDGSGNNYFDRYALDGTYLNSFPQTTTSSYGYRDLAYDGANILGSDDNDIDKINPNTFAVVSTITNSEHSPHRGLAYDPNENVIYSTNWRTGPCIKIDAATGTTLKVLNKPSENVYGIAFDRYTHSNFASLWYAEPSKYGVFRISRVDTTLGNINFSFDISNQMPDSSLVGGLEIINNHPSFPNKIIAAVVDQHSKLLVFVDITDAPEVLPITFEEVGEFGGYDAEGTVTSGMVQYDKYLYSVDNQNLVTYDIDSDPTSPNKVNTFDLKTGNRIFVDNNFGAKLAVTTKNLGVNGFASFDISDPANPVNKSLVTTTNHVRSMILGSYSYVIEEETKKLFVYYMGTYSNPVINKEYDLNGTATCLAIDNYSKLLFVGCNGNSYSERGIHVFDISNPNSLLEKSFKTTNFDYPQKIVVRTSQKKVIVAANYNNDTSSKLSCYDYSDATNLSFKNFVTVSANNAIWDMKDMFTYIIVSIPNDELLKTYRWDDDANIFLSGSVQTMESPIDIESFSYSVPLSQKYANGDYAQDELNKPSNYEQYIYVMNGYASGSNVAGSERTKIIKAKKIPDPNKVTLTMSISPAQAATDGCSTSPPVGDNEYDPNSTVELTAHEAHGWAFKEWEGAAGGNPTTILMDKDKSVTAVFQPTLTVSGDREKYISCICDQKDSLREVCLIHLCASEADDWLLNSIRLKASGSGNEVTDVAQVIASGVSSSATTSFTEDNGIVKLTFDDPVLIPKGDCIRVKVYYLMKEIRDEEILNNSSLNYHVETTSIEAVPVNYAPGLIMGDAQNDKLILAKVYNDDMEIFPTIQEAIDNTDNSLYSDIKEIHVCGGEYNETLNINKIVSLNAVGNRYEPSKIISDGIDNKLMNIESGGAALFCNLKFVSENIEGVYSFNNSELVVFDSCQFNMLGNHKLVFDVDNVFTTEFNYCRLYGAKKIIKARDGYDISFKNCDLNVSKLDNPSDDWSIDIADYQHVVSLFIFSNFGFSDEFNNINAKVENSDSCHINDFPRCGKYGYLNRIRLVSIHKSRFFDLNDVKLELINSNNSEVEYSGLYDISVINSSNVTISHNTIGISENMFKVKEPEYGISLINSNIFGSGNKPMANVKVIKNGFDLVKGGIYALNQSNLRVQENTSLSIRSNIYCLGGSKLEILLNEFSWGDYGVKIENAENIFVQQNKITHTYDQGIKISGTKYGYITDNDLRYNFSNISINSSKYLNVRNNNILNAYGTNTGIDIDSSNGLKLSLNNILNNNGDGIHISGNSEADIKQNNIKGNSGNQLDNSGTLPITAQNNFWGSSSGPGLNDVVGNVDFSNYLSEAVGLTVTPERDTLYFLKGVEDSATVITNNISNYDDVYNVSISETQNWITSPKVFNNIVADTNGTAVKVKLKIQEDATGTNKISVSLTSTTNGKTANADFYVLPYSVKLNQIYISPDSISLALGDSILFNTVGIDQFNNAFSYTPHWSSTNGTIESSGLFKANTVVGDAIITATDDASGISVSNKILITNSKPILNSISINPDTVKLKFGEKFQFSFSSKDQFENSIVFYPIWTASGGTISNGLYQADSTLGIFNVCVKNDGGAIADSAIVIVSPTTGILQEDKVPARYSLSQNYPNPFNPSTTISYGLPFESKVKVEIFNVLGQRVDVIANGVESAGLHSILWDAGHLASGIYIIRINATSVNGSNNFVKSIKMLLLK